MQQQDLPFGESFGPGWTGKRYLLCTDGKWHLTIGILPGLVADTQCGEDTKVILPVPEQATEPMCPTCVQLQTTMHK